jgi:predicted solute-binding protein
MKTKADLIGQEIVEEVRAINPNALIVKNWNCIKTRDLVLKLVESYYKNIVYRFVTKCREFIDVCNFK